MRYFKTTCFLKAKVISIYFNMMQQLHTITFLREIISDLREIEQIDDHAKVVVLSKKDYNMATWIDWCTYCTYSTWEDVTKQRMLLLYNYHRKDCAFHGYDYEWMHKAKEIFSKNIHWSDCGIQISNLINLYLIYNNLYWSHISFLKNESRLVMPCIYIYKYIYENFHCQGRNADMMSSIIICLQNKGMVY